jgi:hypothetical protein
MFGHVAGVDDLRLVQIRHSAKPPISIHTRFSVTTGRAPCHQALVMKPAAPKTFIHW